MIKSELAAQNSWLEGSEQSLILLLNNIADDRYYRELAAGEGLILVIERCIMNSQPLEELWIVSADATPLVDPLTAWDRLKYCISTDIQDMMNRELQEKEALRRKEDERIRREMALNGVLSEQQAILDRTEKMLDAARPTTGKGKPNSKGVDSTEKVGRNPTRGRRDDSAKVRSSLGVNYAAARQSSGGFSNFGSSNPTSAPRSAPDSSQSADSKARELYLRQKLELGAKFQRKRAKREEEYRLMGMSQAAAVLAAHHELFLEERHQMEDFEAKYRTKRPSSSSRNSASKRRDGKR